MFQELFVAKKTTAIAAKTIDQAKIIFWHVKEKYSHSIQSKLAINAGVVLKINWQLTISHFLEVD